MRHVHRPLALALALFTPACSLTVDGDEGEPTYGEVTLTVTLVDDQGVELSRDARTDSGADLVAPLDRELFDPIVVDGGEVSDPSGLLTARSARIGDVVLTREDGSVSVLRASGDTLMKVRSAWRAGSTLTIAVDGGRFDVALTGAVSAASVDRILGTALVRMVRGEPLLADDCRPDCIYDLNPGSWLCAPLRDLMTRTWQGDCGGPFTPEEWAATVEYARTEAKREHCYDLWYIPRPICEWGWDMAAGAVLPYLEPDESGMVCASAFYDRCTGAVD